MAVITNDGQVMFAPFRLRSPIGRSYNLDPEDVRKTKSVLGLVEHYQEPTYGLTEYPDESMFEGIEKFQKQEGLRVDGLIKPRGPTEERLNSLLTQ